MISIASHIREQLFQLNARGIKYDLNRMIEASRRCGDAHRSYPSFHIAGTNGKGSMCALLESALRSMGFKTGLFTSPHLIQFEERFMINGQMISEAQWLDVYKEQEKIIEELRLTFFEATTLMAFEIFRRENVQWAVFETGLGGRLDATNIIKPRVSVIASIGMDHMDLLGDSLASIAGEKLGIVKEHIPLVMELPKEQELRELALDRCSELNTTCIFASADEAENVNCINQSVSFTIDSSFKTSSSVIQNLIKDNQAARFQIPLAGSHQVTNALVALKALLTAGFSDLNTIIQGFSKVNLSGRFQSAKVEGKIVVFDVGHNPQAAAVLIETLQQQFPGKTIGFVTGIMKDKDSAGIIAQYSKLANNIIFTHPDVERAADPNLLIKQLPTDFQGTSIVLDNMRSAVQAALRRHEEVLCVAGSFFTVGEAMTALQIKPF